MFKLDRATKCKHELIRSSRRGLWENLTIVVEFHHVCNIQSIHPDETNLKFTSYNCIPTIKTILNLFPLHNKLWSPQTHYFTYAIWEVASTSSSKLLIDVAWPEIAMEVQRHHSMAWNWKRILLPKLYKQNIAFVEITTCCAMGSKLRIVIIVEIQLYKVGICNEPLILRRKLLWHELSNHEIR